MDRPHEIAGGAGYDREGSDTLIRVGTLPVLPYASQCKRFAALLPDGVGAFWLDPLDRLPLEEAVDGNEAPATFVGVTKCRQ